MMLVKDLQAETHVSEVELTIVAKEPAHFTKSDNFVGLRSVAIGRDQTGEIRVNLWGGEASEIELGDRVRFTNGYVGKWMDDKILSSGKFGHISIIQYEGASPVGTMAAEDDEMQNAAMISALVEDNVLRYHDSCGCANCQAIAAAVDRS